MKNKESIYDVSAELEREFGPKGSDSRKAAEDKAWEEITPKSFSTQERMRD